MARYTAKVLDDRRLELPRDALSLVRPGQEIEIEIQEIAPDAPRPNGRVIEMLRDLAEMKKDMPESDPSDADRIIREGRSGAMYSEPDR